MSPEINEYQEKPGPMSILGTGATHEGVKRINIIPSRDNTNPHLVIIPTPSRDNTNPHLVIIPTLIS